MRLFSYIDERIEEYFECKRRMGFYIGRVSNSVQSFRRVAIDAEWGPTIDNIRRISSPVLDIIPARKMRMAIISQDGIPELSTIVGMIWDNLTPPLTAWIRANLEKDPGRLEVGATKSIHIRVVSEDPKSNTEAFRLEEIPDGSIVLEVSVGSIVHLGGSGGEFVALAPNTFTQLQGISSAIAPIITWYNTGVTAAVAAGAPVPAQFAPANPPSPGYSADSVAASKVKVE